MGPLLAAEHLVSVPHPAVDRRARSTGSTALTVTVRCDDAHANQRHRRVGKAEAVGREAQGQVRVVGPDSSRSVRSVASGLAQASPGPRDAHDLQVVDPLSQASEPPQRLIGSQDPARDAGSALVGAVELRLQY